MTDPFDKSADDVLTNFRMHDFCHVETLHKKGGEVVKGSRVATQFEDDVLKVVFERVHTGVGWIGYDSLQHDWSPGVVLTIQQLFELIEMTATTTIAATTTEAVEVVASRSSTMHVMILSAPIV